MQLRRRTLVLALACGLVPFGLTAGGSGAAAAAPAFRSSLTATRGCHLAHGIRHVIYMQFDNVHLTRDNPRVPSDLQQMPNLLHFLLRNGTVDTHEHTPLIAHTADDIVTSESGLYGDRQGMPIANEYNYYTPTGRTDTAGSFAYWTDPIVDYDTATSTPVGDHTPSMVTPSGRMAPAPWVPYTRAGCDFGSVASANTELENLLPDVPDVFGQHSPQAAEARNPKLANKAAADFMGLSVHCALGSPICDRAGSVADRLPDEPGGYAGHRALFGSRYIQPVISPGGPVRNLYGTVIKDSYGDIGFPGYDGMIGPNALAYTLDMQTHGIPVTFTYLSDLHDSWVTGNSFGPGEAGYEHQLRAENRAFGVFFHRLAEHGITTANTLFVVTADEGDHFVGSRPTPADCNGVTIRCHYRSIGEVDGDLNGLLQQQEHVTTPFDVAADSAPVLYVANQPPRTAPSVRQLARATARLTGRDLETGRTVHLIRYLADPVEERILHLVTGDPKRTASLVAFANPDFWLQSGSCPSSGCFSIDSGEAWNHGDLYPVINRTWLAMAGPGVRRIGYDNAIWSDHTDIQPTMMLLLGLRDHYQPDGYPLLPMLVAGDLPTPVRSCLGALERLGVPYTQLNAAVGSFAYDTLRVSTRALASGTASDDATYTRLESALIRLGDRRDALIARARAMVDGAIFAHRRVERAAAATLTREAERILRAARRLAG